MRDLIEDVDNVRVNEFGHTTPNYAIDSWRGANGFWYSHPNRNDFVQFHLEWFEILARKLDVENPIKNAVQMLFDYPKLEAPDPPLQEPDVLFINSPPGSNQALGYDYNAFENLKVDLEKNGARVTSTWPPRSDGDFYFTCTDVGRISQWTPVIVMVSTGPSWTTFNIWNQTSVKRRIILLDNEQVNLAPNTVHCSRVEQVRDQLKQDGLL